jgi:glycosyltransferase involved in cell wall biosynthesis
VRVFLDASAAAKAARTGVGHYVARLAEALLDADPTLDLTLGVRWGRARRRAHVLRPAARHAGRAHVRWFPSSWPGLAARGATVRHGPDARVVGGSGRQVVTLHDLFSLKSSAWADPGFVETKKDRYAEIAARADAVVCVSEATARDATALLRVPPERIVVTPLGVDASFRPVEPGDAVPVLERHRVRPPYVLFVGLAQPRKNLETIVRVFGRLAARIDDLSLVLAGPDGYPEGRLDVLLKETGAVERVRLLDYVPVEDLPALYAQARALLFPSRDEGFGLPVLEAMACGCPVVASTAGALPEVAGDAAMLFAPDAVDDYEEALARLLDDPDERAAWAARGVERARAFPWSRTATATLAAYARVSA